MNAMSLDLFFDIRVIAFLNLIRCPDVVAILEIRD